LTFLGELTNDIPEYQATSWAESERFSYTDAPAEIKYRDISLLTILVFQHRIPPGVGLVLDLSAPALIEATIVTNFTASPASIKLVCFLTRGFHPLKPWQLKTLQDQVMSLVPSKSPADEVVRQITLRTSSTVI
jgi:hypothetical protein